MLYLLLNAKIKKVVMKFREDIRIFMLLETHYF